MKVVLRLLALVVVPLVALPLQAQTPRYGGELVFPVPSEPPSYDGHREETFGLIHPIAPFYNTLLRVDPNDRSGTKPYPSIAESWSARALTFPICGNSPEEALPNPKSSSGGSEWRPFFPTVSTTPASSGCARGWLPMRSISA